MVVENSLPKKNKHGLLQQGYGVPLLLGTREIHCPADDEPDGLTAVMRQDARCLFPPK